MVVGTDGLKMWVHTLIAYDAFGNGRVVKSYAQPAANSSFKYEKKKKAVKKKPTKKEKEKIKLEKSDNEETLWGTH